jgi:hypothetical protein
MLSPIPNYLNLLADIKCLFSLKMNNQQEDDYQCLLVWAKQMPILQLQQASGSFSEEIQQELLNLLRPVQKVLSTSVNIAESNPVKHAALTSLNNYLSNFYEYFSTLPIGRAESTILKEWQDLNGHGSIPPLQPMPQPILEHAQPLSPYSSLFSNQEKWHKGDEANHQYQYMPEGEDKNTWK